MRFSGATREGWERGATEVCMQGGIHPDYTGDTYVEILRRRQSSRAGHARARIFAARSLARALRRSAYRSKNS